MCNRLQKMSTDNLTWVLPTGTEAAVEYILWVGCFLKSAQDIYSNLIVKRFYSAIYRVSSRLNDLQFKVIFTLTMFTVSVAQNLCISLNRIEE